ncbi:MULTISPECIES: AAA family ATPase [Burkholderia]|uniref:AAA family ATPase n=1 Tax=Burkholderia TaxID=32008 RepID=UPI000F03DFC9|nr:MULTISPECIES: AAA family ATPase [Burkholderia]TCW65019.1 hypothetical protein C5O79_29590 [Burkholderia sp. SRS-25]
MRIDHIAIRNFHGIERAEYDLHPSITVLLGNNATGKSAILDALAILAGSYFLGIDGISSLTIKNDDIRQELRFNSDGSTQRIYHTPSELYAKGEVHGEMIEWCRDRLSLSGKTRKSEARKIEHLGADAYAEVKKGTHVTRPFLGYYSVARLGTQKKETANLKRALADLNAGYINSLNKESSQWAAERWFAGLQSRALENIGNTKEILTLVKSRILSLFQSADCPLDDIRHDPETNEIFVRFHESGGFCPVSLLSSGYESVLSMGLDIIYRIYSLNRHLGLEVFSESPGIALVDETDMHLHPKWQGCIVEKLHAAFPKLQFIFTTHSPFVVQSLRHARIIDLDSDQQRDVGDYLKKSIPEVAEEYMGMSDVERSPYYLEQVAAAEEYFTLLKTTPRGDPEELAKAKARLDEFEIRYNRDPAFVALLRAERNASKMDEK